MIGYQSMGWISGALLLIARIIKSLYSVAKTSDDTNRIVRHMYTNHLPHIEHTLRLLCDKAGIPYEEPPLPPLG